MEVIYRIKFHLKMQMQSIENWLENITHYKTEEEILAEFNAYVDSLSLTEKAKIEQIVNEEQKLKETKRPVLEPRRTMLIHSRDDEHWCNTLTAPFYRKRLLAGVRWAQEHGITTFLADYCTPHGLLALETLVELREAGADFRVYAVRSTYIGKRRTYRIIKETPFEMASLPSRADYCYHDSLQEMLCHIIPSACLRFSERGIWANKKKLPKYLLEAWRLE